MRPRGKEEHPIRAFVKDFSHLGLELLGINAIDDFIADRIDGRNSTEEIIVSTVGLGLSTTRGGKGSKGSIKGPPVKEYEVGLYNELKSRSPVGDNLEVHHVTQAHPSEQIVPGYQRGQGPAIVVPRKEHLNIPVERGTSKRTPGQQLAKDVRDLRK